MPFPPLAHPAASVSEARLSAGQTASFLATIITPHWPRKQIFIQLGVLCALAVKKTSDHHPSRVRATKSSSYLALSAPRR